MKKSDGLAVLLIALIGCNHPAPPPAESPEQAAARIFGLAQDLEKQHKTKEAYAAYRQLGQHYPSTAGGKRAAERLSQVQKEALRKGKGGRNTR
jgi:TolA-binding protein